MKYVNILLFVVMIVMNYLANALPLNNRTTGEISDSLPNLFVPAGITFSIWGIIYLLLAVYCVIQFTSPNQNAISDIGWVFAATCVLNALWIIFWHYGFIAFSLGVMLGLLTALIGINTSISGLPTGIIKAAFGIYLGWICIATIANVTALLVKTNWNGFGISHEIWTITMIAAGALIGIISIYKLNNPFIGLVIIWAFTGIILKRITDFRSIVITASVCIVFVAVMTIYSFIFRRS